MKTIINKSKSSTILISGLIPFLTLALLSTVCPTPTHADTASNSSSANASITISPTIRLTLSGGDLVINDLVPGSTADSNVITASVTTNSASGYFLSATTGTASTNTDLTHNTNNAYKFTNLDSNKASLSNFNDNTWGYSYSIDNGTNWISGDNGTATTGYNGLPLDNDDSGATGIKLLSTDTYSQTGSIKFKIGAKAAPTQASGTYTGVVNFYAVTNPEPKTIATATTMQEVAPGANGCPSTLPTGQAYQLTDSRDGTIYNVARLADGNCWLLDNLALDLTNNTVLSAMSESNTNASNTTLGYLKGTTTRDPSTDANGKYATAGVTNWTTSSSYSAPLVNLTNKDIVPSDTISQAGQYKVGGYYNYCAASAGSYCYSDGASAGTSSGNTTEDICPKGWRMPTGNTSGEYSALANAIYGSTGSTSNPTAYTNYSSALRLPLSGSFSSGSARSQGSFGLFWSSTPHDVHNIQYLYLSTNNVKPVIDISRLIGLSVRCLLGSE